MSRAHNPRVIEELRDRITHLAGSAAKKAIVLPFGVREMDEHLPGGGLSYGALHEIAGGGGGTVDGAAAALFAAGIAARAKGKVLWCLTRPDLFFPAIAQAGLHPDRVIFCEGDKEEDVLASMEEGLSFGGLAAVVGELVRLPMVSSRRLQLAAEKTGTMGSLSADGGGRRRRRTSVIRQPRRHDGGSASCRQYEQWLHGTFDDALGFQKRTFPPELVTMERTSELWAKRKAASDAPLLL